MNRLAKETSPYLRQHADNPVSWFPWSKDALETARRENKPILLSVGYSACHWCHVMAHECFENADIAAVMNAHFINIKVDREERPEVDALYQGVVQLMGRGGGWPLTVFLTPDLRPFFGGTYFPPDDRHGLPGFPKILAKLAEAWTERPEEVEQQARAFREGLTEISVSGLEGTDTKAFAAEDVVACARKLESAIDRENGGFGGAPKFPNPMTVALLLRGWRRTGDEALRSAAMLTLEKMARGGLYDQLGGGFHRYSVDARWGVPHFEKMLYDNAQLLHLYCEAQQVQPSPLWRQVVQETVLYLERDMTAPTGAFYAAQDADSEGVEGKYFVWTPSSLRAALPPELAPLMLEHYGVTEAGNFEHGQTVLEMAALPEELGARHGLSPEAVAQKLGMGRCKLLGARMQRVAPGTDDKVLAGWNGLMIRGLAFASRVFERPDWAQKASRAAEDVLARFWRDGQLFRTGDIPGTLEDYGNLAAGLVALFQATFDPKHLEMARTLALQAQAKFWDEQRGAYRIAEVSTDDATALPVQSYALFDNATPSGASTLTEALILLSSLTADDQFSAHASRYLSRMRAAMLENPFGFGHLLLAADVLADGAPHVSLHGSEEGRAEFRRALGAGYFPTVAVLDATAGIASAPLFRDSLLGRNAPSDGAHAYLCRHFACQAPTASVSALAESLQSR